MEDRAMFNSLAKHTVDDDKCDQAPACDACCGASGECESAAAKPMFDAIGVEIVKPVKD